MASTNKYKATVFIINKKRFLKTKNLFGSLL